jgi:hypothetical protein
VSSASPRIDTLTEYEVCGPRLVGRRASDGKIVMAEAGLTLGKAFVEGRPGLDEPASNF